MIKEINLEISKINDSLIKLSKDIHEHPELGNEEFFAAKSHINLLEKHGFVVEKEYLGLETAFKAVFDSNKEGITVAYLAEYDALPELGHACGHNLLGTVSTGSAIVLSKLIGEIGGKVILFGTPAEETNGAKVKMANEGVFDNVDIALMAHPSGDYEQSGSSLAMDAFEFKFIGKAAHAAGAPEEGINALDAVISTFNSINALRELTKSDSRIHGYISTGGVAPNIIPDLAVARFYVRASKKAYLQELSQKVINCAKGAELATGTKLEFKNYELSFDDMLTNQTLSNTFNKNIESIIGKKIFSRDNMIGSLDAGNVSYKCPTIHPYFPIGGVELVAHTIEFKEAAASDYAHKEMKNIIAALVQTALDVMQDKNLLKEIKDEFLEKSKIN